MVWLGGVFEIAFQIFSSVGGGRGGSGTQRRLRERFVRCYRRPARERQTEWTCRGSRAGYKVTAHEIAR